ncbi:hypothetical protein ABB37_00195 [Leptomonas pyrrhocoris]|uniref:Uncharacterized protein n=1 Tax=Leptomonas pyrrhocoris TaxID=157538 RepID=A0A0M9GA02_LEPPY|nr:hypothetical protein ABB37_00195 [Leptomonas pyrrhocoris]XP_015664312.1 hypothetical protein ABB37_00195 [Leptomonas pyrrhocoris]KPA85872.1 hypothetical protein ABB37_00195 [Leptomonas pyrrhocoris]KPA85873.1 hypothetical protein ABB37_00195 [Leptomonas pyrrhocoris]|eukprot:XP_015664311.1 hypothetical protein ABB37_00195 [Leptomonas pyrrhocoris]
MTSTTRRISVTSEQLQSDTLRAQLFSACCAYGLVEWLRYDEDPNYNTTTVRIQFQKLSSADRLRNDMHQRGQAWQVESEAATPCVGSDVLLSSSEAVTCTRLKALVSTLQCTELSGAGGSSGTASTAEPTPTASMATFEEKSFLLHGRGTTTRTTSSRVTAEQEVALWSDFEQQASALRHSCLGPYCAVLHLASAHDANEFLLQQQLALAERHGVYAMHVGTTATSPLAAALPKMLARHALSDRPVDGRVVRGYVVAMPSNTYCAVDAGLYPSVEQAAAFTLVNTHTNFLSVSLGDEVQVQLSAGGGLSIAGEGMVGGKLLRVLVASVFSTRRSVAKVQLPSTAARTLRTSNLARGLLNVAATHQQNARPPAPPNVANVLRRNTPTTTGVRPLSGNAAKALASKLFKHIQEKKMSETDGGGVSAERICTYPAGLSVYTRLLVRVERIEEDGLHARCVADADNCGYTGPVFIPADLVPSDTVTTSTATSPAGASISDTRSSISGKGWKSYAVVGERMHVALLYMVAVGGSAATMRGVASKKETDLRRAAVAAAPSPTTMEAMDDADGSPSSSSSVMAGTSVTAVAMLQLSEGDLGVPPFSAYARTFPAYLLRATGANASAALRQTPLVLPVADLGPLDPSALTTSPATLTISEVVNDVSRGQYAIVVPYSVYAARQAERAAAQERKKKAEVDEVKRRLAAVMGDEILEVLNDDDSSDAKRPRMEN